MIICVDVGNSSINFGIYKENELICTFKSSTKEVTSFNKLKEEFSIALNEYGLLQYDMEFMMISSVVERLNVLLKKLSEELKIECYFINYNSPLGIGINFNNKEEVPSDLLVGCYQAASKYQLPLVVVDIGTATTIMMVNGRKEIDGGLIYPGVISSYKHLYNDTAVVGKVSQVLPKRVIGKSIIECLQNAMLYGSMNAINGMVEMLREEAGYEYMNVIVTGGLSNYLSPFIDGAITDENLILDGLNDIYLNIGKRLYLRTKFID